MKKILVAVDASARAKEVVAQAVELAKNSAATILLFRAVGLPPEIPLRYYASADDDLRRVLVEGAKKELEELVQEVPEACRGGIEVEVGTPWDAICRAAKSTDASMIVIGSHGYGALDRLLGTTAAKVVNHADRSVLVVRGRAS